MNIIKIFPVSIKSRLINLVIASLSLLLIYGAYNFYQAHLKQLILEKRIQGMDEYQVCQLAFEEFGLEMSKYMGCLDNIEMLKN